jgi:hypothetical protein
MRSRSKGVNVPAPRARPSRAGALILQAGALVLRVGKPVPGRPGRMRVELRQAPSR